MAGDWQEQHQQGPGPRGPYGPQGPPPGYGHQGPPPAYGAQGQPSPYGPQGPYVPQAPYPYPQRVVGVEKRHSMSAITCGMHALLTVVTLGLWLPVWFMWWLIRVFLPRRRKTTYRPE